MKNIYVGNVDLATTEDELRNAFASYGAVQKVSVVTDRETGRPRGLHSLRWKAIRMRRKRCWV
jgi:RNA recognition motif-containing protein